MKQAVMIVLKNQDKFLLGKRSPLKEKAPGYWCPISGHIEAGESEEAAVIREALEELNIDVRPVRKIRSTPTHDKSVILHWWLAEIVTGTPEINNHENSEIGWFSKEDLKSLEPVFDEDIDILLGL